MRVVNLLYLLALALGNPTESPTTTPTGTPTLVTTGFWIPTGSYYSYGDSIITAEVKALNSMIPNGTVQWNVDGIDDGVPMQLNSSGFASLRRNLTKGIHNITITFKGDDYGYNASTANFLIAVQGIIRLNSSPSSLSFTYGTPTLPQISFQYFFEDSSLPSPTGNITASIADRPFSLGDKIYEWNSSTTSHSSVFSLPTNLSSGSYFLIFRYEGDFSHKLIAQDTNISVTAATPEVSVTTATTILINGRTDTLFTAQVRSFGRYLSTMDSMIQWYLDTTHLGTSLTLDFEGNAQWTNTATVSLGRHIMKAMYSQKLPNYLASMGNISFTVKVPTTLSLSSSELSLTEGQIAKITVTVTSAHPSYTPGPEEFVRILIDNVEIGQASFKDQPGIATVTIPEYDSECVPDPLGCVPDPLECPTQTPNSSSPTPTQPITSTATQPITSTTFQPITSTSTTTQPLTSTSTPQPTTPTTTQPTPSPTQITPQPTTPTTTTTSQPITPTPTPPVTAEPSVPTNSPSTSGPSPTNTESPVTPSPALTLNSAQRVGVGVCQWLLVITAFILLYSN